MKLYFLRHGKAVDRAAWADKHDDLRPLTDEGVEIMKHEAKAIRRMKLKLDNILTSPLVRASDTAKIVAHALAMDIELNELLRPDFDRSALDHLIATYSDDTRIMIVGHEPSFSRVIAESIGGGTVVLRKGGLARVDTTARRPIKGELVWLLTPDMLTADGI
jgi:phosphohistidine phosphatase